MHRISASETTAPGVPVSTADESSKPQGAQRQQLCAKQRTQRGRLRQTDSLAKVFERRAEDSTRGSRMWMEYPRATRRRRP